MYRVRNHESLPAYRVVKEYVAQGLGGNGRRAADRKEAHR